MLKRIFLVIMLLGALKTYGQIGKGTNIISISGSFMQTSTQTGGQSNLLSTKGQYLQVQPSSGFFLSDHVILGFGLVYYHEKEKRTQTTFIYDRSYLQIEQMDVKAHLLMPEVFIGYYVPILSKFYFNVDLSIGCGKINTEYNTEFAYASKFTTDTVVSNLPEIGAGGTSGASSAYYFNVEVCPQLTYFIKPKFGLCLTLGGMAYNITDWKFENSQWAVNFNPRYWSFGVKFIV